MTTASIPVLVALLGIGCSSSPTGPATQPDPTAPSAVSSGIQLTVQATGENIPAQVKFFVCSNPTPSQSLELSFLCHLSTSASGAVNSNGRVVTPRAAGVWRVGLDLPGNCRPNPPFAEFYAHSVVSPAVTVIKNEIAPVAFSIACL